MSHVVHTMPTPHLQPNPKGFFLYSRKSTEAEDRQVLSIGSQVDEVKQLAERLNVPIIEVLSEARSAKEPGRPIFNDMMRRVSAGEAAGILCWKLDRLARNPVDGGSLIWAVHHQGIRIVTPTQSYSSNDDNIILMYIEFGMAHKYINDLGRAVKRGLLAKAQRGIYPNGAPGGVHLGYLSDSAQPQGFRGLVPDPARFHLVRQMWELMLTGSYSVNAIRTIATQEWSFRTKTGRPLSKAAAYRLFTNPLYFGSFEYPAGSSQWFKGTHPAMITEAEFDQVQRLLGSRGRPRRSSHSFPFTGLIRCGGCRAMVTAEVKHQLVCSVCRLKFAYRGKNLCPGCATSIQRMMDTPTPPKRRRYVYYHCTKRTTRDCHERSIRAERLEGELVDYLQRITVSTDLQKWVLPRLRRSLEEDVKRTQATSQSQEKAYKDCLIRIENLLRLKTAPANLNGSLLSDEEYASQRAKLLQEKARLDAQLQPGTRSEADALSLVEDVFAFTREAKTWLGDQEDGIKRLLLAVFAMDGSNLTLMQQKLTIKAPKPFPTLEELLPQLTPKTRTFEPTENGIATRQKDAFASSRLVGCGQRDDVRTYGKPGLQLVRKLREWLETAPTSELSTLQTKLRTLFDKVGVTRKAA